MSTFEKLLKVLSSAGVYEIKEGSNVYYELKAYSAGLDMLTDTLRELECEAFIPTSGSYGLSRRERLFGAVRDDLSAVKRRSMLIERNAFSEGDFTYEGAERILEILSIDGSVEEFPSLNRVVVWADNKGLTKGQRNFIVSQLNLLFPAHLEIDAVFEGFSWADSDKKNLTFEEMESTLRTWAQIDYLCM